MICKLCGREAPDGSEYCEGCGNPFDAVGTEPEQPASDPIEEQTVEETMEELVTADEYQEPEEEPQDEIPGSEQWTIHSHMALAVLTTIVFFNWILGIPAIVFARECELAAEAGQYEIARRFSGRALSFALIGVAINIAIAAFAALVVVVMRAAGPILYPYFW